MLTRFKNKSAEVNKRVRLSPVSVVGQENMVKEFCLSPAINCVPTSTLFKPDPNYPLSNGQQILFAYKDVNSPIPEEGRIRLVIGKAYDEESGYLNNPTAVINTDSFLINNMKVIKDHIEETDLCVNGNVQMGTEIYLQKPTNATDSYSETLTHVKYIADINGETFDLSFDYTISDVHFYGTLASYIEALDGLYRALGDKFVALNKGFSYSIVPDGPWINVVGRGSAYTNRLLLKWESATVNYFGAYTGPSREGGSNDTRWWQTYNKTFGCVSGKLTFRDQPELFQVTIEGRPNFDEVDESEGLVLEFDSLENLGFTPEVLETEYGITNYADLFKICGFTESFNIVSCSQGSKMEVGKADLAILPLFNGTILT